MGRYVIFRNPISGEGRAAKLGRAIRAELTRRGHEVTDYEPSSRDDAVRAAGQVTPDVSAVIGVGGDGTQNSLVAGLVGSTVPLMPVPGGTENVLCKAIGIPQDPIAICDTIERGRVRPIDVGFANGRPFAVMSGIGFDATVTRQVHENRHGPIRRFYYYWPAVRNWLFYKWPRLDVEVDGEKVAEGAAFVIVGNMRLYADRLHVCPDAKPGGGLLDICVFKRRGRLRLISYLISTKLGRHTRRSDVVYRQGTRFVVRPDSETVPFQIDGDAVGTGVVEYTIKPGAVRLFVPRER